MMPNLLSAIFGFETTVQFQVVQKTIVDGSVAENTKELSELWCNGSMQPLHARLLLVKPEGERKWKWWTLFTDTELKVDDVVKDMDARTFRVMAVRDWHHDGQYFEYELVEGTTIGGVLPRVS